jgi:excisionase family DNA binding protein
MSLPAPLLERAPKPGTDAVMPDQWLTVNESCTLWKLHRNTVYRHLRNGTLPVRTMRIGRSWRINAADAETFLFALNYLIALAAEAPEDDR